jgi:hypothetical protein
MKYIFITVLIIGLSSFKLTPKLIDYRIIKIIDQHPQKINYNINYKVKDINKLINQALLITLNDLSFNLYSADNDNVNKIHQTQTANCVGYTNYFNSILNELLKENKVKNVKILHARVNVLMCNKNIHIIKDRSLKDHDISIVFDQNSGINYYVDPSLSEIFGNIIIIH